MILVDTCVLVDVFSADPIWSDWSRAQMDLWSARGPLVINPVVYAEMSTRVRTVDAMEELVAKADLDFRELPRDALFLAAKAWLVYRARGGLRTGILSDFFIGAHASVLGVPVLTRDKRRLEGYFRDLTVISPRER